MLEDLSKLFHRDLERLTKELKSYDNEEDLWKVRGEIGNSGGSLAVHLCGNLRSFVGKEIGGFDYVRDREFEFSGTPVSRKKLYEWIEEADLWVQSSLDRLNENLLEKDFPIQPFPENITYQQFLIHLYGHLNYHLGQINYHRRLVKSSK